MPAERPGVLARAPPAPPDPRGRHNGPALGPWSRPSAPQAVAGSLAHRQTRAETGDVRAEWRGWTGMGPKAATAGTSMWGEARERAGLLMGSAAGAMSGMLRRASSWWRKRQREGDEADTGGRGGGKRARQGAGDG